MTALTRYRKLESRGLWRDLPEAQRREVVVNLGDSTLILTDPRSDTALTHWSLPAVTRLNPGTSPAIFSPGPDASETLEIDDPDMIAALETLHNAIERARPRSGRLRSVVMGVALTGVLAAGVFWLPDAIIAHTATVLPPVTRRDIGAQALADLARLGGTPCAEPAGTAALDRLSTRLFGTEDRPELLVLREGLTGATHLPGNRIVLSEELLAVSDGPEVAAGFILAEQMRAEAEDSMILVLRHAGPMASLRLLTTGALPDGALSGYGATVLRRPPDPLDPQALLSRFAAAEVPSTPYAFALDPSGERTLALIEADPFSAGSPKPLLPDEDWVSLQDICTR